MKKTKIKIFGAIISLFIGKPNKNVFFMIYFLFTTTTNCTTTELLEKKN